MKIIEQKDGTFTLELTKEEAAKLKFWSTSYIDIEDSQVTELKEKLCRLFYSAPNLYDL